MDRHGQPGDHGGRGLHGCRKPFGVRGELLHVADGDRGRLVAVDEPSADRIAPFCVYFGTCGGCAIQHLAEPAYRAWKRGLVVEAQRPQAQGAHPAILVSTTWQ